MEASKESVDNLIKNASSTIEDFNTKLIKVLGLVKKFLMELMGECVKKG